MSGFAHEHDPLDVVFSQVASATTRINSAKNRIQNALNDEDMEAGINDLREAVADRKLWGKVHADFWRALGEPGPAETAPLAQVLCDHDEEVSFMEADLDSCCNCGDSNCGCF